MARGPGVIEYLQAGLKAAGLRGKVIGNNIANFHTPNFRRGEVRFEELLAKALKGGREADPADVRAEVLQPQNTPLDGKGNDVSLEVEIGEMVKNGARSRVYLRTLAKLYRQMEMAMQDRL